MHQTTPFVISEFTNPSGEIVFRVSGQLDGKRIRKNFPTRAEAIIERKLLEIACVQAETGIRTAVTRLSDEQLQEAEAAFQRLKGCPQSLSTYLEYAIATFRAPNCDQPLVSAISEYTALKNKEVERTLLSSRQMRSIKHELARFQKQFSGGTVAKFSPSILIAYLERGNASLKTYNNRRGILSTFFKYALRQGWIADNPIEKTPHHRIHHRRGSAVTITAEKAQKLMEHVEQYKGGRLVPYFALCLFAGIRPSIIDGEISKLQPEQINLSTGVIHIEPEVSKVRMKRLVTIQPNLAAWLKAYPLDRFLIVPTNITKIRRKVFDAFELGHDVMRHTFISMFVAKYRSMGEAALQAGNSESIIRKHYLDLKSKEEAEQFFGILPKHAAIPVVSVADKSVTSAKTALSVAA